MILSMRSAMLLSLVLLASMAHGADWNVDPQRSKLAFIATYDGVGFETSFERFTAKIRFDPDHIALGHFDVNVDVSSVNSNSVDRDEGMLGAEWFDAKAFPKANFVSTGVRQTGSSTFDLHGRLTIKDVTRDVTLPFSWNGNQESLHMKAKTVLLRTEYGIGTGDWATDQTIGFRVEVTVDLHLVRDTLQ